MTENKDKHGGGGNGTSANGRHKDKKNDVDAATPAPVPVAVAAGDKEHEKDKDSHDRIKKLSQLLIEKWPAAIGAAAAPTATGRIDARNLLQLPPIATTTKSSPLPTATASTTATPTPAASPTSQQQHHQLQQQLQQQQQQLLSSDELRRNTFYRTVCASFQSAILLLDMDTGEISDFTERSMHKDEFGTQRVYKKTSPNCVLTLYLPTREIILSGHNPSILRGIIYVDPKAIQGYRVYAQLTLTFRYGREDEEVMGLRFCNEAIMSLHQVWPRNEEPARESLSPLQEALVKRLGDGAHPFTLTLTPQAPPSVQLVPAKRYYGAPIGTSYDVRCFIADKTDEKFHRRASVKMGVRVIYRTDVFHNANGPENFAALVNSSAASPPTTATLTSPPAILTASAGQLQTAQPQPQNGNATVTTAPVGGTNESNASPEACGVGGGSGDRVAPNTKPRKSERGDSFPKLRLSPKSFRFSGRFGRSKSEIERCPNDPFYNYSKSFQEYDSSSGSGGGGGLAGGGVAVGGSAVASTTHGSGAAIGAGAGGCSGGGGPQGAVDKPFLLQDGRVGLRASLDKAWYTHGEDVCVTVNIRNDSRKTVRKVRVCVIQHVDVCMFNNGKFKNIVADSDVNSPMDRTVPPGGTLNTTIVLKPQRGQTKNWIALEDTLQRSTEPEEITGAIAASAIRSPNLVLPAGHTFNPCPSPAVGIPQPTGYHGHGVSGNVGDDRNVFAIYVSYYVKVKLTLSGMGGELSLKLPFVLVHVEEQQRATCDIKVEKLALDDVPASKKNGSKAKALTEANSEVTAAEAATPRKAGHTNTHTLDRIESVDDEIRVPVPSGHTGSSAANKRRLVRSETLAKDLDDETEEHLDPEMPKTPTGTTSATIGAMQSSPDLEHVHVVQIHTPARRTDVETEDPKETNQSTESDTNLQGLEEIKPKESTADEADIETLPPQEESSPLKCEHTAVPEVGAEADGNGGGSGDSTNHV